MPSKNSHSIVPFVHLCLLVLTEFSITMNTGSKNSSPPRLFHGFLLPIYAYWYCPNSPSPQTLNSRILPSSLFLQRILVKRRAETYWKRQLRVQVEIGLYSADNGREEPSGLRSP